MSNLADEIKKWMEGYKLNSVKPATYDRLVTSYDAMLKYDISNKDIKELTSEDIQNYINVLVDDGYALSTIKKQFHLIGAFIKHANNIGLMERPIYNSVNLPVQSNVLKKKKEVETYSDVEQTALMNVLATNERLGYAAVILMLESGMRVGEVLALKWCDILWNRKAVHICRTVIRLTNYGKMEVQNEAKSFTSNRTIPLSAKAYETLKALRDNTTKNSEYIFDDGTGKPITYEALRYQIQIACKEANVPYRGQHVFRHTFATNCYHRGCNVKVLSKLLGHADVTVTYNVYIHLFGDALEEMRSVVG